MADNELSLKDWEALKNQPRRVLLEVAVELNPEAVAEAYEDGWTKEDLLRFIEDHVKEAIGNQNVENWEYIQSAEVNPVEDENV